MQPEERSDQKQSSTGIFLQESIVFLVCPAVNDVEKDIEDHTLATSSSFSIYKTEDGLMQKLHMNLFHLLATCFAQSVFFFRY